MNNFDKKVIHLILEAHKASSEAKADYKKACFEALKRASIEKDFFYKKYSSEMWRQLHSEEYNYFPLREIFNEEKYLQRRYSLYGKKDRLLKEAWTMLRSNPHSRIKYKIENRPDQNGYDSLILYFEFNYKGEHYQFSFHNFNFKTFGRKTRGNKNIVWEGIPGQGTKNYYRIEKHSK